MSLGYIMLHLLCSYNSVTCIVISHDELFVPLHQYFPKYECSAQYGCFFVVPLMSCFPGMFLGYCLNESPIISAAFVITGIIFAFTFYMHYYGY